jgi:hypothetical protein
VKQVIIMKQAASSGFLPGFTSTPKIETICASETSVDPQRVT